MTNQNELFDLKIIINAGEKPNLRELDTKRKSLYEELNALNKEGADVQEPKSSRTLDPVLVGTVALALLPVLIDKLVDLVIAWSEKNNANTMEIKIPMANGETLTMTYNPKTTRPEQLTEWLASAAATVNSDKQ